MRTDDIVAELRAVKSPAELALMKHSAHLGDLGFEAMMDVAKPGARGIEIVAEMERAARREGADHAKYWMASGPPTTWEDTRLDIKPHERVLEEGDLMAVCSYIVYRGYWSHGQRTGTMSRPSDYLERTYRIAVDAQDAGIAAMRPGVAGRRHSESGPGEGRGERLASPGGAHRARHRARLQRAPRPRGEQQVAAPGR